MTDKRWVVLGAAAMMACSAPATPDGGTGGGSAGGATGGGAAGGGSAGGSAGGSSEVALGEYCAAFADSLCALAVRCGQVDPGSFSRYLGTQLPISDCLSGRRGPLDAGALRYDGARARQCFAALA